MPNVAIAYKGCVEKFSDLPIVGNVFGDFYKVKETGRQFFWSNTTVGAGSLANWKILNVDVDIQECIQRSWLGI